MIPERRIPQNVGEVMLDVLHGLEVLGASVDKIATVAGQQSENIEQLAAGLARRPTKRQTLRAGLLVATLVAVVVIALQGLIWWRLDAGQRYLRERVEMSGEETKAVVCGLLSDVRSYHPTASPVAPGCP